MQTPISFPRFTTQRSFARLLRFHFSKRRGVALLLAMQMTLFMIPPPVTAASLREGLIGFQAATDLVWTRLAGWLEIRSTSQEPFSKGVIAQPPETKEEKENRLARLEINPSANVLLQSQQPIWFTAIPFDADGETIQGLQAEWESSDKQVVFVKKTGQAIAGKPGSAIVTAKAGLLRATVLVNVTKGNGARFGGKKRQDSTRSSRSASQEPIQSKHSELIARNIRLHHATNPMAASLALPAMPMRDPNDDPLPDNETSSLYEVSNATGSPAGKRRAGAPMRGAAIETTENGNKNFSFTLPVAGLPGRGLDISLALVYNSNVWHKSNNGASTWMTYDVDSSWPAAGWRLTLGQIEDQGSYGFTLTDMDGTRHALVYSSANNYDTTDGTFIHYSGGAGWGTLYYPNGTIVYYGAGGGGYRLYPTQIIDRNGNYCLISYINGVGPKISTITDTLGRYINFYYASNGDLVTIRQPGLGTSTVQTIRFYYTDVSLPAGLFASGINVSAPSSVHTLQYVYLPTSSESTGAHTGYKFDYSPYGMVRQITEYRGMTASSTSTTSPGTVSTSGASIAAQTTYNYPTSGQSYTDVPTYSRRTDDWAGRTTSMGGAAPYYDFSTNESTGVSTVTAPDSTITETHSIVNAGQWNDGLVSDTYIKSGTTTYAQTHLDWQQDANSRNARVYQIRNTDSVAGLTKSTVLTYTSYNNVSVVSERDFTTNGTVSTTELRKTVTDYVNSANYINRHLLHLPASVRVYPGGSSTAAARVDYTYDNYGTNHANMTARDDIIMHDPAFDPFQQPQESCDWVCYQYDWVCHLYWEGVCFDEQYECVDLQWECSYYNPYDSSTDYRGNVTSVTTYTAAATPSGAITHSTTYDIAGNVTSAQLDCCQLKTISYTDSPNTHTYAFPTSVTSGNPSGVHTTTANTYDFNTGLVGTATDANNQTTTAYYNSDSLRLEHVTSPGGGATYFTYSDWLTNDAASSYHFYIKTSTKLDNNGSGGATRYVDAYTYFDGRGAVARTMSAADADGWSARDVEYDTMGRAYRSSNPYYASAYSSTPLSSSNMFWTTSTFDHLGRVTQVTMPRGDNNNSLTTNVQISYAGVFTTVTDQAGKVRRQKVDALGRVIRLDEPTTAGLGTTATPNQATNYYYDVLDNLVRINQGSQNRYFKYDSLSRLIRERAAEQTVNASYNLSDALTGNSSWTRKIEYNSSGLVTNDYDARGVQTTFSYDELNRVTQVSYSDATPAAHYYYDAQNLPAGAPSTSAPDNYARGSSTGRLVAMTYGAGATGTYFGYDTAGRVVQQFQLTGSTPAKYKLSYAYNYAGLSTGETYPSGRAMSYSYDNGGRLSQVRDATTIFANSLAYAAHGGLTSETWGNTAVHAVTYNRRLQASQVKLNLGTNVQQQYDYGYGEFNPSTGAVDTSKNNNQLGKITATIGATPQWNQGFSYDELGRLSNLTEHQGGTMTTQTYSQSYAYDRYGNRTQSANSLLGLLAVSAADYNTANNRFVSSVAGYDNSGNITSDLKFRSYTYAYDANGRQRTVSASGNTLESATYDAAGQRVQTVAGSSYRTFVYDIFGQLVADYNGSSGATLESENIYRGRQLLAQYKPGTGLSYVLTDVQGSARTTMNNSGSASTVIARHDYLPFGEELAAGIGLRTAGQGYSGADYNRQKYALTERDEVTGLDHTWWRKYESLSGRWTSPDPLGGSIGDPQSFNRYSYVNNNPVNIVDPTGLEPCIWDPPSGNYCIYGGPDHSPIDNGDPHTRYLDNFDPWGGFGAGRGIGGGVGGAGGVGAGIGATVPQNPEPKRNCTFPTYDQLSAAQQGLLDAGTYGGLSDAQRANFLNQTGALAKAGINLGKATLQEGGILTDRLLFSPGTSLGVFKGSIEAAIASGKFIKDTPVASKHPGMSDFGARQNRTFNALQVGFGSAGAFVDIDRGNPSGGLAGLIVHGAEVLTPGKTDPFAVGKDLGKKVTGYTCK